MILSGKETAAAVYERTCALAEQCASAGHRPVLAVVRVGDKGSDLAYERGIRKNAEKAGIEVETRVFPENVSEAELTAGVDALGGDAGVDGILVFLPLPKNIDQRAVVNRIPPEKDVDGAGDASMLSVYKGSGAGFAPCTAQAVMEILDLYEVPLEGARVCVVGRSLVVGKPLFHLLLGRNATVTVCHSRTKDLASVTLEADIVVTATGHAGTIRAEHVREGQAVIDVDINFTDDGKMVGDAVFDEVNAKASAVTPVPGGVGAVTTSVLLNHVAQSAAGKMKIHNPAEEKNG